MSKNRRKLVVSGSDWVSSRYQMAGVAELRSSFGLRPLKWRKCRKCGIETHNYFKCDSCWSRVDARGWLSVDPMFSDYGLSKGELDRLAGKSGGQDA